ncbi:MAG: hypothetical protein QME47_07500 [Candidatus Thermoplasmatota archaeon]|nr:hypothetical protein [Candidatus Thermoplasmatota archaeon]
MTIQKVCGNCKKFPRIRDSVLRPSDHCQWVEDFEYKDNLVIKQKIALLLETRLDKQEERYFSLYLTKKEPLCWWLDNDEGATIISEKSLKRDWHKSSAQINELTRCISNIMVEKLNPNYYENINPQVIRQIVYSSVIELANQVAGRESVVDKEQIQNKDSGNANHTEKTRADIEVVKTIDLGSVKYELLDPKHVQELIFSYHLCEDFALQPVFYPAIVKREAGGKTKRYVEEEKICPFVLFSDSNGKREMYPIDTTICVNGRKYKIKAEPEQLPTMPSAEMVQDFLKGKRVDGKKLWQDVKNYISTYIDFTDSKTYVYYTAFLMATYFYYVYNAFPYNHFHGEHNSGKSQAQRIGFRLAFHGEYVKKITSSQIFRTIESTGCSFFIEEAEHLWSRDVEPELQQVLNAGYQKDGVARITDKNTLRSLRFNVYGPKSFSSIREMHPTLRTRTVQNLMLRTLTNKGDLSFDDELARKIRDELYILRLQEGTYFAKAAKNSNHFEDLRLSNRDRELFIPLLQVTEKYASEEELEQLKQYIKEKIEEEKTEYIDSDSAIVYRVVKEMLGEESQKWLLVTDVRTEVIKTDPHAYRSKVIDVDGHEIEEFRILESSATARRFTAQRVGYIMKNMGLKRKRYTRRGIERFVTLKKLKDLESRYIEYADEESEKREHF